MNQHERVHTQGRGLTDITARVADLVDTPGGDCGLVHIFIHHTSASLIIQENADPDVRRDLDAFFRGWYPMETRSSPTWTRVLMTCLRTCAPCSRRRI